MAIKTLSYKTDADVVKTELPNRASRDEVILSSGSGIVETGTLLGKVGAEYVPYAPAGANGSQTPVAVILETADATDADQRVVALARTAEIVLQSIVWPAGTTAEQKSAALAALDARAIVARMGV
jgi:hypothetical protein